MAVIATGILAGCGSSAPARTAPKHPVRGHARAGAPGAGAIPAPGPTGLAPGAVPVAVIQGWSTALRHGNVAAAARYFALPSVMINGPTINGDTIVDTIHTRAEARAANASLPCGAQFISADLRGRYVNALFRLTDRPGPGGGCGSGAGQTARTNFLIRGHRIIEWIRAPDDPGDNGAPIGGPTSHI